VTQTVFCTELGWNFPTGLQWLVENTGVDMGLEIRTRRSVGMEVSEWPANEMMSEDIRRERFVPLGRTSCLWTYPGQ
jgi:hypothetical protein